MKVYDVHIQFLAKFINLQNVKTMREVWHGNLLFVSMPPSNDKRSGNQRIMINVHHTDCHLYACEKRTQSNLMEDIYFKKCQWGPKIKKLNFCIHDGRFQPH